MSKYIKAEVLKNNIHKIVWTQDMKSVEKFVDMLPAADVEEVRHGRWVDVEPAPHNLFYATCSVCGDRQTIEVANYCPMCGASMYERSKCVECKGGYCEDECGAKMDEVDE